MTAHGRRCGPDRVPPRREPAYARSRVAPDIVSSAAPAARAVHLHPSYPDPVASAIIANVRFRSRPEQEEADAKANPPECLRHERCRASVARFVDAFAIAPIAATRLITRSSRLGSSSAANSLYRGSPEAAIAKSRKGAGERSSAADPSNGAREIWVSVPPARFPVNIPTRARISTLDHLAGGAHRLECRH